VVSGSTATDAAGEFSFTTDASGAGDIRAAVTDSQGLVSDPMDTCVEFAATPPGPVVVWLRAAPVKGGNVILVGQVADTDAEGVLSNPSGVTVTFTGVISGTATADADGCFALTVPATASGTVSATATDGQGLTSDAVTADVALPAPPVASDTPVIDWIMVTPLKGKGVLVTGMVSDANPDGLFVNLTGAVSGTATTDATGAFSLFLDADALGTVWATATDGSGRTSDAASATFTSPAPQVQNFSWTCDVGVFHFTGQVLAPDAPGMSVTLQGEPKAFAQGQQVTVGATGWFNLTVALSGRENNGTLEAIATDCWGQQSNAADLVVTADPN
jgi:hypothetical protein